MSTQNMLSWRNKKKYLAGIPSYLRAIVQGPSCPLTKLLDIVEYTDTLRKHSYSNIMKILLPKKENFQTKNSDIFHIPAQNIVCVFFFLFFFFSKIRKIMYTPVNPSFTIQKWGLNYIGVLL